MSILGPFLRSSTDGITANADLYFLASDDPEK